MTRLQIETWCLENIANFTIIFGAFLLCRNKRFLEIVTFMTLPNCYYQIVTFLLLPIYHYQIVTFVSLPNCHYQIVVTKLSPYQIVTLPNCHFQIVITKLSPYQIVITKLSLPNCHYQIDITKNPPVIRRQFLHHFLHSCRGFSHLEVSCTTGIAFWSSDKDMVCLMQYIYDIIKFFLKGLWVRGEGHLTVCTLVKLKDRGG